MTSSSTRNREVIIYLCPSEMKCWSSQNFLQRNENNSEIYFFFFYTKAPSLSANVKPAAWVSYLIVTFNSQQHDGNCGSTIFLFIYFFYQQKMLTFFSLCLISRRSYLLFFFFFNIYIILVPLLQLTVFKVKPRRNCSLQLSD